MRKHCNNSVTKLKTNKNNIRCNISKNVTLFIPKEQSTVLLSFPMYFLWEIPWYRTIYFSEEYLHYLKNISSITLCHTLVFMF